MEQPQSNSESGLPIAQPAAEQSPCAGCHSGCCRAFVVPLTGPDIVRIKAQRHLTFWDFACRYADPNDTIARGVVPHFHFDDEPETPFVIGLLQEASTLFPNAGKCRFLVEHGRDDEHPLGKADCSIYEHRPMTCRAFPTRLNARSEVDIVSIPQFGRADCNPAYRLCPRPWSKGDVDEVAARDDLRAIATEMQQTALLAERWNKSPRSWRVFPELIQMVFGDTAEAA